MFKFFQIIKYSFFSKEFYRETFLDLKGWKLQYLLYVTLLAILPLLGSYYYHFNGIINSSLINDILNKFPSIEIHNNKMSTQFEDPYTININEYRTVAFVSDNALINQYKKQGYYIIFSTENLKFKLIDGYQNFAYNKLFGKENLILNQNILEESINFLRNYQLYLVLLFVLPFILFTQFLKNGIEILLFAFIAKIFISSKSLIFNKTFKDYFRLMVFAFYPSIIFSSILPMLPGFLLTTTEIAVILLRIYFSYFAIRSILNPK